MQRNSNLNEFSPNKNYQVGLRNFSDKGFKKHFKDGSNQVQHATAAIYAGFSLGPSAHAIHRLIRSDTPPDTLLNDACISIGIKFNPTHTLPISDSLRSPYSLFPNSGIQEIANTLRQKLGEL